MALERPVRRRHGWAMLRSTIAAATALLLLAEPVSASTVDREAHDAATQRLESERAASPAGTGETLRRHRQLRGPSPNGSITDVRFSDPAWGKAEATYTTSWDTCTAYDYCGWFPVATMQDPALPCDPETGSTTYVGDFASESGSQQHTDTFYVPAEVTSFKLCLFVYHDGTYNLVAFESYDVSMAPEEPPPPAEDDWCFDGIDNDGDGPMDLDDLDSGRTDTTRDCDSYHGDPVREAKIEPLPTMTTRKAKRYTRKVLKRRFGNAYRHGSGKRVNRCSHRSRIRVRCRVRWFAGDVSWRGRVTVRYRRWNSEVDWDYAYRVRRTNWYCKATGRRNCHKVYRVRMS